MNKLSLATRVQILSMLVEGSSMRSVSRVADVSINTVTKLLVDAGTAADTFQDQVIRGLKTAQLQCDEIWAFCQCKQRNRETMKKPSMEAGDVWTFTALDSDSKLIVSWYSGARDTASAHAFMKDAASRIDVPVQVNTDGFQAYTNAVSEHFGWDASHAQVNKVYSSTADKGPSRKYSPGIVVAQTKDVIFGNVDYAKISTSHVERQNLNIRMGNRRFTRLTNGFSRKLENHSHALALYFFHYNFCRIHKTLKITPAMAAGITDELLDMTHLVQLIDAAEEAPKKRGPYKKRPLG